MPDSAAAGDIAGVPFFRPSIGDAEIAEVVECLKSGWLTTGPKTHAFEARFAEALAGVGAGEETGEETGLHAVAVNSATAAMHLGLEALGIGPGDEVVVPTLTFTATAEVVRYLGAEPVLADIDPTTLCLSPETVAPVLSAATKAVMPVHFAGRPCDMTALAAQAAAHGAVLLDDAAHAFPASHAGRAIGTNGAAATAFSFYANKTITTGEGGMLVTADADLAARARTMRLHGIDRDVFNRFTDRKASWMYDVVAPGFKYNMTDIAAALGLVQLGRAEEFGQTRARLAARYDAAFADLPLILPPHAAPGDRHSWHLYIVRLSDDAALDRDGFVAGLQDAGIGISVHYRPLHQMSVWAERRARHGHNRTGFPGADDVFAREVSLPLFMAMSEAEQDYVIAAVRRLLGG